MNDTPRRPCLVCGKSQANKKVGSRYGKRVICLACHAQGWEISVNGSAYRAKFVSEAQR